VYVPGGYRDGTPAKLMLLFHGAGGSASRSSRRFVPALRNLGYDVTYREYEGGHSVPEPVVREAFAWFAK
jgi:phospholipase/carboxylesterase